jgi:hypothetical protein
MLQWRRQYTKLPWREIKTKDTLEQKMGRQALIKAKQRKEASGKSIS